MTDLSPTTLGVLEEFGVRSQLSQWQQGVARRQAAAVAGRGATVVYVGGGADPDIAVNFGDVLQKDLTIRGNSVFTMGSYYDAVEFLLERPVPLDDIVTHRFRLEQAVEAFALFDSGETGKVIFEWDRS